MDATYLMIVTERDGEREYDHHVVFRFPVHASDQQLDTARQSLMENHYGAEYDSTGEPLDYETCVSTNIPRKIPLHHYEVLRQYLNDVTEGMPL